MAIQVRRSSERGYADHGWFQAKSTFSFAGYYDPNWMQYGPLRVMQEDVIAPNSGFDWHPHRDMEIITIVLAGALRHRDNMGHESVITHGHVQRMSAGTGVMHSEFNASTEATCHLHQIWILPDHAGIAPSYEEAFFSKQSRLNRLCLVVSPKGEEGAITVHQDARIFLGSFDKDVTVQHSVVAGRGCWIQVPRGCVTVAGEVLNAGDGIAIDGVEALTLDVSTESEVLVFDVPLG